MVTLSNKSKGDIIEINAHGHKFIGLILDNPLIAFFGINNKDLIENSSPLFAIWVSNLATNSWKKIGTIDSIPKHVDQKPLFFKKDAVTGNFFKISCGNDKGITCSREDCLKLECAAVWEKSHVEDRLRDYKLGVKNKWVLSLQP